MAFFVEGDGGFGPAVSALLVRYKTVAAFVAPLYRTAQFPGGQQNGRIFGVGRTFHAEGTADVVSQYAYLFRRHAHDPGDAIVQAEDALAGHV